MRRIEKVELENVDLILAIYAYSLGVDEDYLSYDTLQSFRVSGVEKWSEAEATVLLLCCVDHCK